MTNPPPPPPPAPPPSGRYVDPRTGARWRWDGRQWRPEGVDASAHQPVSRDGGDGGRRRRGCLPGITFAAVVAVLFAGAGLLIAVLGGQEVRSVDPSSGQVEFYSTAGAEGGADTVAVDDIRSSQGDLEARVDVLEQRAVSQADDDPAPSGADFSGQWFGANGLTYSIRQFGSEAVIEELSPYGLSAVGEGSIVGETFEFSFESFDGSFGTGTLTMMSAGFLSGTFVNDFYGTSTPASMERL